MIAAIERANDVLTHQSAERLRVRSRLKADISRRDNDVVMSKYHLIVLKHPVTERHSSAPA
jgi:hypothetical protein